MILILMFLLFFMQNTVLSSRILIISQQPYFTNQNIAVSLAADLASRGHEITIFTSHNFERIHKNVINFNFNTPTISKVERNSHKNWLQIYHEMTNMHAELSIQHMEHPEIMKIINKESNFDLLIIDCVICSLLAIAEVHDIPAIYLSPTEPLNFVNEHFGNEVNPSIHPETHVFGYKHGRLTLYERFNSYVSFHYWKFLGSVHHCMIMRKNLQYVYPGLVKSSPSSKFTCHQLLERLQFLFIFTHPAFGNVRPIVPKTIQCGFTYVEEAKEISNRELRKFLDSSKHGSIVFNVNGLDSHEINAFLNVFKQLKQSVVLNVKNSTNYSTDKIFPITTAQISDIIGHPSIKLVVSTADYREIEVLLKNGLPMLLVPLTHEETVNARLMNERKVARVISIIDLCENQLLLAINDMLDNEKLYRENVRKLERFASDRPKLKELATWHVEFVIRHKGAKHLDYPGRLVPYYQKLFLDIYLFFAAVFYGTVKVFKGLRKFKRSFGGVKGIKACGETIWARIFGKRMEKSKED